MSLRRTTYSGGVADDAFRLKPIARSVQLALLPGLFIGLSPNAAQAASAGGAVQAGQGYINQNATKSVTSIYQGSQRLAIDWQSFNVKPHELVQFHQPNARASALNRIFDQRPSEIFGRVKANGQVVLLNPNGVFFKPGAQVNVGILIAGAMQIGIDDFMSGNYKLKALEGAQGRVINQGRIEAALGGDVTLVGKSIANQGVIVATAGRINLVAGEQVTVDFDGDGLLKFTVDKAVIDNATVLDDQISNTGDIIADGGDVLITASAADGVFKNAINNGGAIEAARIDKSGGSIMLVGMGPGASILNTGRINAHAGTVTDDGGSIHLESNGVTRSTGVITALGGDSGGSVKILRDAVVLAGNALVDASGSMDGGEILVGGDYQGANAEVRNAATTDVGEDVRIRADAGEVGDGGKVIVWADGTTTFHGTIEARGGTVEGDGGFTEVSGKEHIVVGGHAYLGATNGAKGHFLIDPGTVRCRGWPEQRCRSAGHVQRRMGYRPA